MIHTIYADGLATIIALDGVDAHSDLPGVSIPRTEQIIDRIGDHEMISKAPDLTQHLQVSVWAKWGWTFQEWILSPRRIIFTKHEVYFRCESMDCREDLPGFIPVEETNGAAYARNSDSKYQIYKALKHHLRNKSTSDLSYRERIRMFSDLISSCSRRQPTFDEDSLRAISALLGALVQHVLADGIDAGLPTLDFPQSLIWRQRRHGGLVDHQAFQQAAKRSVIHCPS